MHHLFEVFFELSICFVEGDLHPLLQSRIVHSHFVLQILDLLRNCLFDGFEFFPEQLLSILEILFLLGNRVTNQAQSSLNFFIPVLLVRAVTFNSSYLIEIHFVLVLDIAYLIVDILLKGRDDLFKAGEFRFHSPIGLSYIFHHDSFNFLKFCPVVIDFIFDALLAAEYLTLNIIHHFLKLFILF